MKTTSMAVLLIALLSGAMFYLSQGLANVWALAWIAPTPLLWLAYTDTARWKVLAATVAAIAAAQIYLLQCYWGQIPLSVIAPFMVAMCVLFPLSVWFAGEGLRRGSAFAALLGFPALWTAMEFGIGRLSPHGTFGALAYAEVSFPPALQIASLFGVHAVTFVLCLSANALALLARRRWAAGTVGIAACALVLIFGYARLAEPAGARVRVAALADADSWHTENRDGTLASVNAAVGAYASRITGMNGLSVAVIPEGAIQLDADHQAEILAPLASAAKSSGALIVVGTFVAHPIQNRAFALRPDGTQEVYAKRHLLLPFEPERPGRGLGLLGNGYATQICKDMDFPETVRGTARGGVRLMMVPANDFGRDGWVHARMAIMRGVENGFAVVRSAFNGLETISDADGRLLAVASTMQRGMVTASADVPLGPGPTLYTRIGDVFSWLCVALSLSIGGYLFAAKERVPRAAVATESSADGSDELTSRPTG
jgi:apolipoprotein N-acyltransferase